MDHIFKKDIFEPNSLSNFKKKFEIIFLDPPYKEKRLDQLLKVLIKKNLLKRGGIFIIHRHKKDKDTFPSEFNIIKEKSYGISKIIFGK